MKKIISMLLITAMCMTLFAGCGSKSASNSEASTNGEEEKPVLKIFVSSWDGNEANQPIIEDIKAITGYDVEYYYQPQDANQLQQKFLMDMASDVEYDLVKFDENLLAPIASEKVLMPLTDLLNEYGSNVLDATVTQENWNKCKLDDGEIYAVPYYKDPTLVNQGIGVRTDILEKHGLEMPTTTAQLEEVLTKVKELEPDMIPYVVPAMGGFQNLVGAFNVQHEWRITEDGKSIEPSTITEDYKNYLIYLNNLYEKGLLDPEFAATNNSLKQEKMSSGKSVFSSLYWWDWKAVKALCEDTDKKIEAVPLLEGPNKDKGAKLVGIGPSANVWAIPKTSKHPEDAMKFLNAMTDYENAIFIRYGKEGEHYKKTGEDTYELLQPKWQERVNGWWYEIGREDLPLGLRMAALKGEDFYTFDVYEQLQLKMNDPNYALPDPTVFMTIPPQVGKNSKALRELASTWSIGFIMGDRPITDFDKFVEAWKADGGQESIDLMKAAYTEYLKSK